VSTWGRRGLSRAVRARILARDGGVCQLGYPGCTYHATEIDDIVPVSVLGVGREQLDDDNRQAVCHHCHHVKTEAHRIAAVRASQQRRAARRHLPVAPHPGEW
jgi:5-methylcytosine-specific restriction endonuclease McrA